MSQYKTFQRAIAGTLITTLTPALGFAASVGPDLYVANPGLKFPVKASVNYAAPLSDITDGDRAIKARVLDWRKPALDLSFDLSEADHTDKLQLLLTADPLNKMSRDSEILVQFNNDTPVPIRTRGQGFDAQITLNPAKVRSRRNTIRLIYPTPAGADCVMPQHGAWLIDLQNSKLVVGGRAKSRALQLREVEMRLDLPAIAPRRVGVITPQALNNATALQALAAQGVGLRMETLPTFTTTKGQGDFEIIMARRDQLHAYTNDAQVLNGSGSRIFVPRGRPMRLIMTADTDAELLSTVQSFAIHKLPKARRQVTSVGEMRMQSRFSYDIVRVSGTEQLSDIPGTHFVNNAGDDDWASGPQALRFSVADPASMSGEVLLKLSASENVSEDSQLRVALNGELLGSAKLDKTRKTVAFTVRPGALRGNDNVLTLTPELKAKSDTACPAQSAGTPNFVLGRGSKLMLTSEAPSPITELSRMAATGAPFTDNDGASSYIALPKGTADYNASLRIIAQIAKSAGAGMVDATYARTGEIDAAGDRHVLVLGQSTKIDRELRTAGPTALDNALKGQAINGDNLLSASYGEFAATDEQQLFQLYAAQYTKTGRIRSGGVAALFGSPKHSGRVIGVITNTPGQSFATAATNLVKNDHWNELQGGVARWNSRSVLLAQTAAPVAGYRLPVMDSGESFSDKIASFEMPDWKLPSTDGLKEFGVSMSASIKSTVNRFAAKFETSEPTNRMADKSGERKQQAAIAPSPTKSASIPATPYTGKRLAQEPKPQQLAALGDIPKLRGPIPLETPRTSGLTKLKTMTVDAWDGGKDWSEAALVNTKAWLTDFRLGRKVDDLQDQMRPLGNKIKSAVDIDKAPGMGKVRWADRNLSPAALILLMAFGIMFLLMALASPQSRLGGRH
ncbi:cellulose biosynthesis cyclic di-GMP-binding regulatory protein BcsB [Litorimonas sp. RW-G-Af-16]|uniref:cellulose biosynthesis cyclic di-GMP-binding regulatory protein BcsB n=1 Tax=Litorimonas sp. RW-G-Af-16 TaxID=3241168 RepID=UPI00390C5F6D